MHHRSHAVVIALSDGGVSRRIGFARAGWETLDKRGWVGGEEVGDRVALAEHAVGAFQTVGERRYGNTMRRRLEVIYHKEKCLVAG